MDIDYIKTNIDLSNKELAKHLKISLGSIMWLKNKYNLRRISPWSKKDINFLAMNYEKYNSIQLGDILKRSKAAIQHKLKKLILRRSNESRSNFKKEGARKARILNKEKNRHLFKLWGAKNKGRKRSEESKLNQSKRMKGLLVGPKNPMYGKKLTEQHKQKISKSITRMIKEGKLKAGIELWKSRKQTPNRQEIKLNNILQENYPNEWKFVGDGDVILGRFCPDFININGKKLIIELNGDYWHKLPYIVEKDERKLKVYSELGYETLTIWEHELKDLDNVSKNIKQFMEGSI